MASLEGPGIRPLIDVDITIMTPSAQLGKRRIPFGCRHFRHMGVHDGARESADGVLLGEFCRVFPALHQAFRRTGGVVDRFAAGGASRHTCGPAI